ncbi:hypothetical protein [Chromobacterium haemolyticum]|uniref:hypothetical protein n=1 Tax=Chromobacterium haemolyticum TaxID=394935 RepID=UPI0005BA5FC4|nr:hypothetical protein [Chromobacterium haemolyticum]
MLLKTLVTALLATSLLSACGSNQDDNRSPGETTPAAQAEPAHHYVLEDNGMYGYQSALTEEDQKKGRSAGDVVMILYLGKKNDLETIALGNDIITCKTPCEYAKSVSILTNRQEFVHATPTSLLHAMFEDAANGVLKPMSLEDKPPEKTQSVNHDQAPAAIQEPLPPVQVAQPEAKEAAAKPMIPIPSQDSSAGQ